MKWMLAALCVGGCVPTLQQRSASELVRAEEARLLEGRQATALDAIELERYRRLVASEHVVVMRSLGE